MSSYKIPKIRDFACAYIKEIQNNFSIEDGDLPRLDIDGVDGIVSLKNNIKQSMRCFDVPKELEEIPKSMFETVIESSYEEYERPLDLNHFVNFLFTDKLRVNFEDFNFYREMLTNYCISEDLNAISAFSEIPTDYNRLLEQHSHETIMATVAYIEIMKKERVNLFASLNVFFENYLKTPIGKKRIALFHHEYEKTLKDEGKNIAIENWIKSIVEVVNMSSQESFMDVKDGFVNYTLNSEKEYSRLFFNKRYEMSIDDFNKIMELKSISELDKYENDLIDRKDLKIDLEVELSIKPNQPPSNSVMIRSLASTALSKVITNYYLDNDIDFKTIFNLKDDNSKGNKNLGKLIVDSFEYAFTSLPEKENYCEDHNSYENCTCRIDYPVVDMVHKTIIANPILVMSRLIGKDKNSKFNKEEMDEILSFRSEDFDNNKPELTSINCVLTSYDL